MSYVYLALPCALMGPSIRLMDFPRSVRSAGGGQVRAGPAGCCAAAAFAGGCCLATGHPLCCQRRFQHTHVGAAPADVAIECAARLLGRWVRMLFEQRDGCGDETRRAEAAHQRVLLAECLLHRVEHRALCEAFDRTDLLALRLDRERRARVDRLAVDDHRARAARPAVADAF